MKSIAIIDLDSECNKTFTRNDFVEMFGNLGEPIWTSLVNKVTRVRPPAAAAATVVVAPTTVAAQVAAATAATVVVAPTTVAAQVAAATAAVAAVEPEIDSENCIFFDKNGSGYKYHSNERVFVAKTRTDFIEQFDLGPFVLSSFDTFPTKYHALKETHKILGSAAKIATYVVYLNEETSIVGNTVKELAGCIWDHYHEFVSGYLNVIGSPLYFRFCGVDYFMTDSRMLASFFFDYLQYPNTWTQRKMKLSFSVDKKNWVCLTYNGLAVKLVYQGNVVKTNYVVLEVLDGKKTIWDQILCILNVPSKILLQRKFGYDTLIINDYDELLQFDNNTIYLSSNDRVFSHEYYRLIPTKSVHAIYKNPFFAAKGCAYCAWWDCISKMNAIV